MEATLALDPADATRVLVPLGGPEGVDPAHGNKRPVPNALLRLKALADGGTVGVWAGDAQISTVQGHPGRALAAALGAGAIGPEVPAARIDGGAALSVPADAFILFRMYTGPGKPAFRADRIATAMAGYRAAFPGEEDDPDAPTDRDALLAEPLARLLKERPDLDPEGPEVAELLDESITWRRAAVPDASCDAASVGDKLGGLPYAEAGWSWPVCPCCGVETAFLAQARDPMTPGDLVQLFHCLDPGGAGCKDYALQAPERHALVRLFRMPDLARLTAIAPQDPTLLLPGHRFDAPDLAAPGDAALSFGGMPTCLRNQHLADDGSHRVMEVWFPATLRQRFDSDVIPVVRRGRGRVMAWADDG